MVVAIAHYVINCVRLSLINHAEVIMNFHHTLLESPHDCALWPE
jgi:hypothetical protein